MSIFSRLADIINSNISAILDRAEDPEKMIRLMIQEMEDTLVEARSVAARVIADRKEGQRRLSRLAEGQAEWQRKAELALSKGREDLAKAALIEKARLAETAHMLDEELQHLGDALAKQEEDIVKLEAKLKEAKTKQKTILARHETATSRLKVRQQVHVRRMDDAFMRFEQMERRLDNLEGEVEAYDLGRGKSLAEEISDLEAEQAVERELAELKARLKTDQGTQRA
jgi:phage shock protein A